MATDELETRRKRKEEGKRQKRQRIEESGGVRPRTMSNRKRQKESKTTDEKSTVSKSPFSQHKMKTGSFSNNRHQSVPSGHRFGRVMENVPCRNKPRFSTVSIALPGSVLSNCQTKELRTLLVGQIARAATIYHVDEIVVFDDKLGKDQHQHRSNKSGWRRNRDQRRNHDGEDDQRADHNCKESETEAVEEKGEGQERRQRSDPQEFMARLLQYCECPQYLRRHFFPMHPDLQFVGLLAPVDAPHHVRADDHSIYREGVVLKNKSQGDNSVVNCGIRNRPVEIDRKLSPGIRCTVKIDPVVYGKPGPMKGTVVSPSAPREDDGTYWGYSIRMAASLNDVFAGCPYEAGEYDLKIGTSERGDRSIEEKNFKLPTYDHAIVVFGGVAGIEECVDADESIKLPGSKSKKLFHMWLNTCPFQGSRTIRTEEAVLISLAQLSPSLANSARDKKTTDATPENDSTDSSTSSDESSED